ncbi:MAG: class I SAM-dependent methyltransferase [Acidimicrobiales bacterium]
MIADAASLSADDCVIDVGCGPGTAVREAARRGAQATGVDPAPEMLMLARWLSTSTSSGGPSWREGSAESLPIPDGSATVVWSLSSVHHWSDRAAALREISRVLSPGGRVLLVERSVRPGARGHAAHGLTDDQVADLVADLEQSGLSGVTTQTKRVGHRTVAIVSATSP